MKNKAVSAFLGGEEEWLGRAGARREEEGQARVGGLDSTRSSLGAGQGSG